MTEHPTGGASPPPVGACRVCGDPSWLADDTGAVHLCCRRWEHEQPGVACPACAQSRENASAQRHRRRPALLPWPRLDTAANNGAEATVASPATASEP